MTSGQFAQIPISQIVIERDSRQRRDPDPNYITELADSIRRLGLIHVPVVTRDLTLVAGECRILALKQLGWILTPIQYVDELAPHQLKAIELEENVKRRDLSWKDRVMAIREFHQLMKAQDDKWSSVATAKELGFTQGYVSSLLGVGDELAAGNQRVADAPKLTIAQGIVRRANERREEQALLGMKETVLGGPVERPPETILNVDFNDWIEVYEGPRFNFFHCDFPYGIKADSFNQSSAPAHGSYEDTQFVWLKLLSTLRAATERLTTPTAHLMFWFAMRKEDKRLYEATATVLESMGWSINPMPLIWMKTDGSGILPDPERGPRQIYETCFMGSKGDRKIVRAKANAYGCPIQSGIHMSVKPEPMLRHFFEMFVDENTVMLDPTCGSGSSVRAAESLGARLALGLEINKEFCELAREAQMKARKTRRAAEAISA